MKKFTFLLLVVLTLSSMWVFAQGTNILGQSYYNISTAVPFLSIAPDARAGAMGDIGCATSADVNSQSYNPAKYVFSKNQFGFSFSYSPWMRNLVGDINHFYLAGYLKITDADAIGASFRYISEGEISYMDEFGNFTYIQKPNEYAIDLTYSRKLIDQLSIAVTPRLIYSDLDSSVKSKNGFAADLSLFYEQDFNAKGLSNSTLRAGLCFSNLSFMKLAYTQPYDYPSYYTSSRYFLPANLKLGIGYEMDFDGHNKLTLNGEVNKLLVPTQPIYAIDYETGRIIYDEDGNPIIAAGRNPDVSAPMGMIQSWYDAPGGFKEEMQEVMWALGMEYSYRDFVFARFGYFHESPYKGDRQYLTVGAGIKYSIVGFDFSYLIATQRYFPLANTMRFTLSLDFVSAKKDEIKLQGRPWRKTN